MCRKNTALILLLVIVTLMFTGCQDSGDGQYSSFPKIKNVEVNSRAHPKPGSSRNAPDDPNQDQDSAELIHRGGKKRKRGMKFMSVKTSFTPRRNSPIV